jgi:hypothetical protein
LAVSEAAASAAAEEELGKSYDDSQSESVISDKRCARYKLLRSVVEEFFILKVPRTSNGFRGRLYDLLYKKSRIWGKPNPTFVFAVKIILS